MTHEQHTELIQLASTLLKEGDDVKSKDEKKDDKKKVKKDDGIHVSFKWTNIDVRNFLTWIVTQNDKAGKLDNIQLGMGGAHKKQHKREKDGASVPSTLPLSFKISFLILTSNLFAHRQEEARRQVKLID